eukprot:2936134-Rhodomonas_salina.1
MHAVQASSVPVMTTTGINARSRAAVHLMYAAIRGALSTFIIFSRLVHIADHLCCSDPVDLKTG